MKRSHLLLIASLLALSLALTVVTGLPAGEFSGADFRWVVVRAFFDDRQMVNELAAWKEPWEVNYEAGYLVVDVTAAEYDQLLAAGFRLEVDRQLTAELSRPRQPLPGQGGGIPGYPCYRTVEETFTSAQALVAQYPTLASWTDIGDSWEKTQSPINGYDIMVLRLTNQAIAGPKPPLLIFGSIHAREYTTAETATRFAEYLLGNYGADADATWLLDYHDINLVLQANPDGRKRAETGMLWRKNTDNDDGCSTSYGVDLNRNFQFHWGCCGGSSGNACAETYRGPAAASEPETQAVQDYGALIFPDQRAADLNAPAPITATGVFLDLHSYAEEILWSWGFTGNPAPNHTGLQTLARKMGYFNDYDATQSLYTTDGSTKDFFYGEFGVPGYTVEMGTDFFQQCSYFENTMMPENLPFLVYAAKAARTPYITPSGPDAVGVTLSGYAVAQGAPVTLTVTMNDTRYNNSQGAEPTQNIAQAEYYIDAPPWITDTTPVALPMAPTDGSFNSPIENAFAVLDTSVLAGGRHILFARGQDAAGNWGAISAVFLDVVDAAPEAGFTSSSPDALGDATSFTNTSIGTAMTFEWDFGDGSPISTEEHPSHTYAAVGLYTVTLTAGNVLGSDSYSASVEVTGWRLYLPVVVQ